jgi:hypothetical protein
MFAFGPKRVIQTGRSVDEVLEALKRATVPGRLFAADRPTPGSPPLRGTFDGATFSVVRRSQFRNSFTPIVEGVVVAGESGAQLQLTLGMHLVPLSIILAWVAVIVGMVVGSALDETGSSVGPALAAMVVVGPAIGTVAYRAEIERVVEDITLAATAPPQG